MSMCIVLKLKFSPDFPAFLHECKKNTLVKTICKQTDNLWQKKMAKTIQNNYVSVMLAAPELTSNVSMSL